MTKTNKTTTTKMTGAVRELARRNASRASLLDRHDAVETNLAAARLRGDASTVELCEVALRHLAEALHAA